LLSDNDFSGYFGSSFWPAPSDSRREYLEQIDPGGSRFSLSRSVPLR